MNARCPHCASIFVTEQTGAQFCPMCGRRIDVPAGHEVEGAVAAVDPDSPAIPWEHRGSRSWPVAFFETLKGVLFSPGQFWDHAPSQGPLLAAIGFGWLVMVLETLPAIPITLAMNALNRAALQLTPPAGSPPQLDQLLKFARVMAEPGWVTGMMLGSLLLFPLMAIVVSSILHLFAKLFGGKGDFSSTVRAYAYALSPFVVAWVPFIGGLLGLYTLVLLPWGLARLHKMSVGAGVAAVAVPLVLWTCCGCGLAAVLVFAHIAG